MSKQKRQFEIREPKIDWTRPCPDGVCEDFLEECHKFKWFLDLYAGEGTYLRMLGYARNGEENSLRGAIAGSYDMLPKDRFNLSAGLRPPGFADYVKLMLKYT